MKSKYVTNKENVDKFNYAFNAIIDAFVPKDPGYDEYKSKISELINDHFSAEEYAAKNPVIDAQASEVIALTGRDFVYWTKSGTKFHLYSDCRYINASQTTEIFKGSVESAHEVVNITELCSACKTIMMREKGITEEQLKETVKRAQQNVK